MRRSATIAFGLGTLCVLGWLAACQGDAPPSGPELREEPDTFTVTVTDALPGAAVASLARGGAGAARTDARAQANSDVAYISFRPGTVVNGVKVVISNPRTGATVTAAMIDGGFDPVPVRAAPGDSVQLTVIDGAGTEQRYTVAVPTRRPIRVVRTIPPRGKTDVPLNSRIVIVFSEPVDASTLTSTSVQLIRGGSAVAGTARLLEGTTAAAVFEPSSRLDPNTQYRLVVTNAVRDLAGDALVAQVSRDFTTGAMLQSDVNYVSVRPDSLAISIGSQVQLSATAYDFNGNAIAGVPVTWSSDNPSAVTVSATGLVTAVAEGGASIFATAGGMTGYAILVASPSAAIASVELSTDSAAIRVGGKQWLYVLMWDTAGGMLPLPRPTQWTSSNPSVATVADGGSRTGIVTGVAEGLARIAVWVEGKSDTMTVLVSNSARIAPSVVATTPVNGATGVSRRTSISVTFQDVIDESSLSSSVFTVRGPRGAVAGEISTTYGKLRTFNFSPDEPLDASTTYTVRLTTAVRDRAGNPLPADYVWTFETEVEPPPFSDVVAVTSYGWHTCALTTSGAAHCWGDNTEGQFGDGTIGDRIRYAVPAARGLALAGMSAGYFHTCGVTAAGTAYCWGSLPVDEEGSIFLPREPTPVSDGLSFASLSAGFVHTCGVTQAGSAYCWGRNGDGELGDGDSTGRSVPTPVVGGLTFDRISAGSFHTCALTPAGAAYCWGTTNSGDIGDGAPGTRYTPVAVAGGLTFDALSVGLDFTCGIATGGAAYCWGLNSSGQLGDGTTTLRTGLAPVTGGLTFASISTGFSHSCGITIEGAAYCWGPNNFGQLGDGNPGSTTIRSTPVPVSGAISFIAITAGRRHSCGVSTTGNVYCWGENSHGQLGNNSTTNSSVPVMVRR